MYTGMKVNKQYLNQRLLKMVLLYLFRYLLLRFLLLHSMALQVMDGILKSRLDFRQLYSYDYSHPVNSCDCGDIIEEFASATKN